MVDRRLKVLSIPADHPYPKAIKPSFAEYLPDPDINGHWWPHPALEAEYWAQPRDVDLVHLHFGFEHRSAQQIQELVDILPVPLVLTVHDLDNPHLITEVQQREHRERLQILVAAAATVITLTEAAARCLYEDYGATDVAVVPHPAITDSHSNVHREPVAGVFLKSLRNNVVSDPEFYRNLAKQIPLRAYVHSDPATLDLREALRGSLDLRVHEPFSDVELHREIASVTTCLLPYSHGTHSGWLEMCRDLGTTVVAPDVGCYAGQADCPRAVATFRAGDARSAAQAIQQQLEHGPIPYQGDRQRQLEDIRDFHSHAYERLVHA